MSTNIITFSFNRAGKLIRSLCKKFEIWRINNVFQFLQIKKLVGKLFPTKSFEPCAYYKEKTDVVIVMMDRCVKTTSKKTDWGSTIYRNNLIDPENIIGFEIHGIKKHLQPYEKASFKKGMLKVSWLICRIANGLGGHLDEIFGDAFPIIRKILLDTHEMTIRT